MGSVKSIGGSLLGGLGIGGAISSDEAISDAASTQKKSSKEALAATRAAALEARGDINRIFPQAQQTARQGFQGALDVFGQSLPAQTDVFTQGNVGAQQQILSGLPQIQNALLGGNIDFSQLQPFQAKTPDLGFFQQTLPENTVLTQQLADIETQAAAQPAIQAQQEAAAQTSAQAAIQTSALGRLNQARAALAQAKNRSDGRAMGQSNIRNAQNAFNSAQSAFNKLK